MKTDREIHKDIHSLVSSISTLLIIVRRSGDDRPSPEVEHSTPEFNTHFSDWAWDRYPDSLFN